MLQSTTLVCLTLLLFVAEYAYIRFGQKRGLVEPVTSRSSHRSETAVPAGGFIFPVAVWCAVLCGFHAPLAVAAVTLAGIVCITDDFHPLPDWLRLLVQVGAMLLICAQTGPMSIWMWVGTVLLGVAMMNAFNFMDGINGMTALYSAAVLVPLTVIAMWLPANPVVSILPYMLPPLLVFGFFNVRRKPLCFAGDVGAVTIGLVVAAAITAFTTAGAGTFGVSEFVFLLSFVLVYGVDTGLTLLLRIIRGENIRRAHRSHLYQLLVNEAGYSPVAVSAAYAGVQILVDAAMVFCAFYGVIIPGFIILTALLCADYFYIHRGITTQGHES